jgi:hypothetical protein
LVGVWQVRGQHEAALRWMRRAGLVLEAADETKTVKHQVRFCQHRLSPTGELMMSRFSRQY